MSEPCESCGRPVELRDEGKWWERFWGGNHALEHDAQRCRDAKAGVPPWPLEEDEDLVRQWRAETP